MRKLIRHIILGYCLIQLGQNTYAQQGNLITYQDEQHNYLRWTMHPDAIAYQVSREVDGDWQALDNGRIPLITQNAELRNRLGGRTDLLLGLLGYNDRRANIEPSAIRRAAAEPEQFKLLQVYTLLNPDYAEVFGLLFTDDRQQGNTRYKISALTARGEVEWVTSDVLKDYQKDVVPIPTNVSGKADHQAALLSWDKDQVSLKSGAVVSYHVYRSTDREGNFERVNFYGMIPGSVSYESSNNEDRPDPNRQQYGDFDLVNGQSYFYHVKAVNAFGIESAATEIIEVIPNDQDPPAPPSGIEIRAAGHGVAIGWDRSSQNVSGYEIERAANTPDQFSHVFPKAGEALLNVSQFIDFEANAGIIYYYRLRTVSEAGIRGSWSVPIEYVNWDKIPPAAPIGVRATATDDGKIVLSWLTAQEEDVIGYHVERANDNNYQWQYRMNMKLLEDTIYIDDIQKESQTTYGYVVYAVDRSLNQSPPSDMVYAKLPDIVPPQAPIISALNVEDKQINLQWLPVIDEDLDHYKVYRSTDDGDFEQVGKLEATTFKETVNTYGKLQYRLTATDETGNESQPSTTYTALTKASPYPDAPISGSIDQEDGVVTINWVAPNDNRVTGFLVSRYRGDGERVDVKELNINDELLFRDQYVRKSQRYLYEIRSKDANWQLSKPLQLEIMVK